ncbi:odorant receptor 13a-like [Frieseomelitta varia]|uniref:odorant receptor 13a-like n=1 Tax=Frieseomelitta varia TaxID=561572 RepID=UPI001CB6A068|nr:odorant receptor 13a-like [Frieseomelitta varia]
MRIAGFWLSKNYAEERRRKFATTYSVSAVVIAVGIVTRDLYFSWGDFSDTVYTMCNVVTVVLVLLKFLVSLTYKKELIGLIQYAKTNFWHSNYDSYEQMIVDKCKQNIGKNDTDRILPFNLWLNNTIYNTTPYFEMQFVLEILSLYHVGVCYLCFDNILCIINLHTAGQFRILQYRFANMCNTNDLEKFHEVSEKSSYSMYKYRRLKTYIQQHQMLIGYCKSLEHVFNLIVFWQVSLFSLLICLDGYLALTSGIPFTRRLVFTIHMMGSIYQLLMFTYSCDTLIRDSSNVGIAVYGSLWSLLPMDKYGKMLRRDMILVILRSKTPCCLTASGFFIVSLETYTKILSTAVSYFTLLKNSSDM